MASQRRRVPAAHLQSARRPGRLPVHRAQLGLEQPARVRLKQRDGLAELPGAQQHSNGIFTLALVPCSSPPQATGPFVSADHAFGSAVAVTRITAIDGWLRQFTLQGARGQTLTVTPREAVNPGDFNVGDVVSVHVTETRTTALVQ